MVSACACEALDFECFQVKGPRQRSARRRSSQRAAAAAERSSVSSPASARSRSLSQRAVKAADILCSFLPNLYRFYSERTMFFSNTQISFGLFFVLSGPKLRTSERDLSYPKNVPTISPLAEGVEAPEGCKNVA